MINKHGYPSVVLTFFLSLFFLVLLLWQSWLWGIALLISLLLLSFSIYFFRDPLRQPPSDKDIVVSGADGRIIEITRVKTNVDGLLKESVTFNKISVFMNVFNVHVNRMPISGLLKAEKYIKGKFFNASLDKSSKYNERKHYLIEDEYGQKMVMTQIAGLVARRIVSFVETPSKQNIGKRIGMIKFGSRVELYLPLNYEITVKKETLVKAGISVMAIYKK